MKTRKVRIGLCLFVMLAAVLLGVGLYKFLPVSAETQAVAATEIAAYVHENRSDGAYENGYDTDTANYKLLWGDISSPQNLNAFSSSNVNGVYKYDGTNKIDCFFYYAGSDAGLINAGQQGYETVVRVTVKADAAVTVNHAAFTTTANNLKLSTILRIGDAYITAKSNACGGTGTAVAENEYGGTYHLAAGEELFFVVGSTNTYAIRRNAIAPSFVVDTGEYSEEINHSYVQETIGFAEIAEAFTAGNRADYEGAGLVTAGFRYGAGLDALNVFTSYSGEAVYAYDGTDGQNTNFFFRYAGADAGRVNAGAQAKSVVWMRAETNCRISVRMPQIIAEQGNVIVGVAVADGNGAIYTVREHEVYVAGAVIPAMDEAISLKAGEQLFWYVGSRNEYYANRVAANPVFEADAKAYDEAEHAALFESGQEFRFVGSHIREIVRADGMYIVPEWGAAPGSSAAFVGWTEGDRLIAAGTEVSATGPMTYWAAYLDMETTDGASVRLNAPTGLRWRTQILKSDYDALAALSNVTIQSGTLIVPADYLGEGAEMSFEWLDGVESLADKATRYLDVVNSGFVDEAGADGMYVYYGSIVNIFENNYFRKFAGVGYVKVTVDGQMKIFYGGYEEAEHSRSVYEVAYAAYNDRGTEATEKYAHLVGDGTYSPYTVGQLEILKEYIDGVVNLTVADGKVTAVGGEYYTAPYSVTYTDGVYTAESEGKICTLVVNGKVTVFTRVDENKITFTVTE